MKRQLLVLGAILLLIMIAAPCFAEVEFKYGGAMWVRLQSHDNLADGSSDIDDNSNWIDQRLRMHFSFIASERLQVVTKWEADTTWGNEVSGMARHGGGDVGADATNLEMKNVYLDFLIPETPVKAKLGVQGIDALSGWMINDDFSAALLSTKYGAFNIRLGYIAARNEDVTDASDNMDDMLLGFDYADGPMSASLYGFWQAARNQVISTQYQPSSTGGELISDSGYSQWKEIDGKGVQYQSDGAKKITVNGSSVVGVDDNNLFDIGLSLGYKMDWVNVFLNYVQNLGGYDVTNGAASSVDYRGFMVEAGANFNFDPFTFTLGGFYASGDDDSTDDVDNAFRYPKGASHYWSEIMGNGTLDSRVGEAGDVDHVLSKNRGDFNAVDGPSNLWTITAGASWQALRTTKLTFNYYYIQTAKDVISDLNMTSKTVNETSKEIGHEFDFYLDQQVVDGLALRLIGAYLVAGDAISVYANDDNIWEAGAQLLWTF